MPRPSEPVRLEDGLKLDLNGSFGRVRPGWAWGATIIWSYRYSAEVIASGRVSADMKGEGGGSLRMQLGPLDQGAGLP
jgi:hypothetical protein